MLLQLRLGDNFGFEPKMKTISGKDSGK